MDPTDPNIDTQPAPTPEPAAPVANSSNAPLTMEMVQRMIEESARKAFASGAAAGRRAAEGKGTNAAQAQPPASQPSAPPAVAVDHLALRAFDRSLGKFDLTDDAMAVVEEDFARANPPDPVAWVTARANAYGWRPRGAQATATTTNVTNPAPAMPAHPATAMPGTTPPVTVTSDTPLTSLGKTDLDAAIRRLGPHEFSKRWFSELATSGKRIAIR